MHRNTRFHFLFILILGGCISFQTPRYTVSVDNTELLKKYKNKKIYLRLLTANEGMKTFCDTLGSMEIPEGSFVKYIKKAINDEFKVAGLYSEKGDYLTGEVINIEHYQTGLNENFWNIGLLIRSGNGHNFTVRKKHQFVDFYTCKAAASEFVFAVQDLIKELFSSPDFEKVFSAG